MDLVENKTGTCINLAAAEFVQSVYDSVELPNNFPWTTSVQTNISNQQSGHDRNEKQKTKQKCDICSLEFCTVTELDVHLQQGCEGLIEIESNAVDSKPTAVDLNTDVIELDKEQSEYSKNALKRRRTNEKCLKSIKLPSKASQQQQQQQPKCTKCGVTFSTKSNLARHHRRKHSLRNGQEDEITPKLACNCEVCGKLCENEVGLKIHRRTHFVEHPFQCRECGQLYSIKAELIEHCQQAHSNERPFQCKECGQGFKEKWALTRHYTRHTDEMPFECWLCHRM